MRRVPILLDRLLIIALLQGWSRHGKKKQNFACATQWLWQMRPIHWVSGFCYGTVVFFVAIPLVRPSQGHRIDPHTRPFPFCGLSFLGGCWPLSSSFITAHTETQRLLIAQTLDANRWPECSVCQEDQHIKKKKRQNRSSSERHLHPHCLFLRQLMAKLARIIHHRPCNIMRQGWRDLPIKVQERGQQVNTVSSFLCKVVETTKNKHDWNTVRRWLDRGQDVGVDS